MTVVIGARDPRRGEEAAAAVRASGGDAHAVTLDVTDEATVQEAAKQLEKRFGQVAVYPVCAGSGQGSVFVRPRPTRWSGFDVQGCRCRASRDFHWRAGAWCWLRPRRRWMGR
ncbi:SDR family NAD(P)-dependent oxidoreductase [Streptomyces sp. NPDC002514]|uniref:SDR family NAD(P)-dependent oxidoreductase n=1 Tax=unclassified Streptomyces TaxID=2593676 RepID=UPI00368FD88D